MFGIGGGEGVVREGKLIEVSYLGNQVNVLIYFYCVEVGKMIVYCQWFDMMINWLVVMMVGFVSFVFGDVNNSYVIFLFVMFMNYFFLCFEVWCFCIFEIVYYWVCIMECFFYFVMLGDKVDVGWYQFLFVEFVKLCSFMMCNDVFGWWFNCNYLWIYVVVLFVWFVKFDFSVFKGFLLEFFEMFLLVDIGSFFGWLVFLGVGVFYVYLIWLVLWVVWMYLLEEG